MKPRTMYNEYTSRGETERGRERGKRKGGGRLSRTAVIQCKEKGKPIEKGERRGRRDRRKSREKEEGEGKETEEERRKERR